MAWNADGGQHAQQHGAVMPPSSDAGTSRRIAGPAPDELVAVAADAGHPSGDEADGVGHVGVSGG